MDQYFRQFSGHTQVNAGDIKSLRYPNETQLAEMGRRYKNSLPKQDSIDEIINEVIGIDMNKRKHKIKDPIKAKKKIYEALDILQSINVPRQQQKDRSALTLLSLLSIKSSNSWKEAKENLIGITEMMNYFENYYGIKCAPNTRETVRRQTIHQFLQMGLVDANPDDHNRPINSPNTRYVINSKFLELVRSYGGPLWQPSLQRFVDSNPSISMLHASERLMNKIPVRLLDGQQILISSGGQNQLIKLIVEEFCPRFTPGGIIVYLGDASVKITGDEQKYFMDLGIILDPHGKMPDLIVELSAKKWLVLIEAVTSHGPIDIKRHNELIETFKNPKLNLVFITAFQTRQNMKKYLNDIAWETEVWVAENPSHLIHFNGDKFLGPYERND